MKHSFRGNRAMGRKPLTVEQQRNVVINATYNAMERARPAVEAVCLELLSAIFQFELMDKHQFTQFSCNRLLEQVVNTFDAVKDKYVKFEDIITELDSKGVKYLKDTTLNKQAYDELFGRGDVAV